MKKNTIKKAGAIIMSRDFKSIALIFRPEKNDWTFPKGHIEKDETEVVAMAREIMEETGMLVEIKDILPNMEYLNDERKNISVKMFLAIFVENKGEGKIGDEQVEWISIDEVSQKLSYQNLKGYFSSISNSLKSYSFIESEIILVISQKELFIEGAQLILGGVRRGGFGCQIILTEDWIFGHNKECDKSKKTIFYFLTNVAEVVGCVQDVSQKEDVSVNEKFLLGEKSKFYLQKTIEKSGVNIPKSFCPVENNNSHEINFPCYIKSQNQASIVVRVENKNKFDATISQFRHNDENYYLEEVIEGDDIRLQKVYYVDGKIFSKEDTFALKNVFNSISSALNLEVFSADIFSSKSGEYWVIDVNPAPSFFKSDEARESFVQFLAKKCECFIGGRRDSNFKKR